MRVRHLVVDSGALIKLANIKDVSENVYTCTEVVAEIKDKTARRHLTVLPYQLHLKAPSSDSIRKITEVSKVSGDYRSLSSTDIKVLALTYELALLHGGTDVTGDIIEKTDLIQYGGNIKNDINLPGFFFPSKADDEDSESRKDSGNMAVPGVIEKINEFSFEDETAKDCKEASDDELSEDESEISENVHNEDKGWITPSRLREMNLLDAESNEEEDIVVACMTTDFAMQNVLKKMNIKVASVDGMIIKSVRSYVLRCHACFEITKILTKMFCPKCGNKTLKRVPVQLNPDGTMKLFFSRNPKVLNPHGLKYSLPKPQGGKHANNPILVEDQRVPHNRPSRKALQKTDVWSDNYDTSSSPFAFNDTESKAFRLGIRPGNRRGGCRPRRRK